MSWSKGRLVELRRSCNGDVCRACFTSRSFTVVLATIRNHAAVRRDIAYVATTLTIAYNYLHLMIVPLIRSEPSVTARWPPLHGQGFTQGFATIYLKVNEGHVYGRTSVSRKSNMDMSQI